MLTWTYFFLAMAAITAALGLSGSHGASGDAKILSLLFLVMCLVTLIAGDRRRA